MAAQDTLRVDPAAMRGFAEGLGGRAEDLRNQLAALDNQVGAMLGGWRGASGSAYASAWELWHRGAGEVEVGLSLLARLVAEAGGLYHDNEAVSERAMRGVVGG
ncbi:WXG100 family type VII secretion target [Mycobacterium heidelbergense]|uniref:ESAT-6-like protein n=1 Tax=Mycobacterium heidelbergense TaxID=53376 RepID=A0A1X0DKU4_MYCHE|nr:WXG100 family type VII secretion target [Mycobacterium heidelbergense]MCV7050254.1 WXG100 family type VII secretion target [Mycobacterium heidelbergense]ORA72965.1 WXG100 family type VII secretion target [Mycobacterium heidelbergense]BBZ49615.1 ESAT-6-like protein EsxF [Mycobacterium heidelbergense]